MNLRYETEHRPSVEEFADLLARTSLGARRPLGEPESLRAMLDHANLICTCRDGGKLVGVARALTDFVFCCYLSDLAVDETYQRRGIGVELMRLTQSKLGPSAKIILLAAPGAEGYYPKLGFDPHGSAWVISSTNQLG